MYLFLSSNGGYKRVDLIKTVGAAWEKRFNKPAPDLAGSDSGFGLSTTILQRSEGRMVLHATVLHETDDKKNRTTCRFGIAQEDFKE
jgi:hypothetical protein